MSSKNNDMKNDMKNDNNVNKEYSFTYNNSIFFIPKKSLKLFENNCISIAILSNYYDKKDDSKFTVLYLPEISITYASLLNLFFYNCGKSFVPHTLNTIWNSIKGINLINDFLKIFEEKTGITKNELSVVSKIKLYKEWSFTLITTKASNVFALNKDELNIAISSAEYNCDNKIYVSINFLLFSEILQTGINMTLPLLVSDIPESLYINNNKTVTYNFECCDSKNTKI
jgi:hypothetical protein